MSGSLKQQKIQELVQNLEQAAINLPLATAAQDIVPGEGDPNTQVMFIGEAPGYHESVERRPFVGRSGKFLRKTMAEQSLAPEKVWISNIVKVRPPDNRDPLPAEITAYKPFLDEEISIIQPVLIVTLGRFSMAKFLPDVKISQVHGRLHKVKWKDKPQFVLPMYHPAAALRGNAIRESFVADFQKINKILNWVESRQSEVALEDTVKDALL